VGDRMEEGTPLSGSNGNSKSINPQIDNRESLPLAEKISLNGKENHRQSFNQDPLNLTLFQAYYRKTYNLILKIVEEFITGLKTGYDIEIKDDPNFKPAIESIHNFFSIKIFEKIKTDKTLDNTLEQFESDNNEERKSGIFYKNVLLLQLEEYFQLIRTFSLIFINEHPKDFIHKLGIYNQYKHKKNTNANELEIIYSSIPFSQKKLIKENSGVIKGKSDIKAAVFNTIRRLEESNNIEKSKYNADKIYKSYLKLNKSKPYQELIKENLKKLDNIKEK
jgi:hypothetical protein